MQTRISEKMQLQYLENTQFKDEEVLDTRFPQICSFGIPHVFESSLSDTYTNQEALQYDDCIVRILIINGGSDSKTKNQSSIRFGMRS